MSADNWAQCPRCKKIAEAKKKELGESLMKAYGKVDPDEYLKMVVEHNKPILLDDTLREDYEIRTDITGEFCAYYRCHCSECHFTHQYEHEERLKIENN